MNRHIYSTLFYLATPALLFRLWWRSLSAPDYKKRWRERFALYGKRSAGVKTDVIFHAVSVGEVHAAVPLIRQLQVAQPNLNILVTTTTPTGSARVTALLAGSVGHVYLPYDTPAAMKRFLRHYQPRLLVVMETEWWPNLMHYSCQQGITIMLANARLSEKSQQRYTRMPALASTMLNQFTHVTAQSAYDSERLQALGLAADRITVAGSMKYDMTLNTRQLEQARRDKAALAGRPVLIAASTRILEGEAEEEKVLQAFAMLKESNPDLLLVLVPRHPERFGDISTLAENQGYSVARRSRGDVVSTAHQILVGDSMGEMHYYYGLADIAFVGGSLVNTGCQNIIEPAAMALPVVTGPSLFNFQAVSDQLLAAKGMRVVADARELADTVKQLLADRERLQAMGAAAQAMVAANQGATTKNLTILSELLATAH